jgi:hypothetical protein
MHPKDFERLLGDHLSQPIGRSLLVSKLHL